MLKIDLKLISSYYYTPVCSRNEAGYVPFLRFILIAFLLLGVQVIKTAEMPTPVFSAAGASSFFYVSESAVIVKKENMFVKQALPSYIYVAENAVIVGKENMFVIQRVSLLAGVVKKQTGISKQTDSSPAKNAIAEKKSKISVFALPPAAANLSFSVCGGAFAIIVPQHRLTGTHPANRINRENQYLHLEKSDFPLYFSKLRQKFSPSAIQCGMLVSFGANSPNNGTRYTVHEG